MRWCAKKFGKGIFDLNNPLKRNYGIHTHIRRLRQRSYLQCGEGSEINTEKKNAGKRGVRVIKQGVNVVGNVFRIRRTR